MILDFNPTTGLYFLRVPLGEGDPAELMAEYGLDFSLSASTLDEAVLFTKEPYAAASFGHVATPRTRERLAFILDQIALSWAPSSGRHIDVPEGQELHAFQKASVDYALSRPHTLIGDDMGTGKTMSAIAVANEMRARQVLVVCPAAVRFQWCRQIAAWSTMGKTYPLGGNGNVYAITSSRRGTDPEAAWTVISWDLIRSPGLMRALAKGTYDLLILDEAHYAKTYDAKRTRAVFGGGRGDGTAPLIERAERTLALTGTPLPNRPREAYTLARGLCWESIDFLSEDAFTDRYNPTKRGQTLSGKVWVDERVGRTAELQNRLRANFMVRHLKRDVMPWLHTPIYDLIRVEETRAVKVALAAERLLDIDPETFDGADIDVLGHIAEARRIMGVAMAPQVAAYLRMLVEGGEEKLTVFAWHIEVLDILQGALATLGVLRVDGRDSARSKDAKVQTFIKDPEKRIMLGNVLSLGTGTDGLQLVCSHALLAEPDWVNGNNQQSVDRLDREGQAVQVQADLFVAPGSISERVLAAALRKGQITYKALDRRLSLTDA